MSSLRLALKQSLEEATTSGVVVRKKKKQPRDKDDQDNSSNSSSNSGSSDEEEDTTVDHDQHQQHSSSSKQHGSASATLQQQQQQHAAPTVGEQQPPVKRKRGRPRKYPLKQPPSQQQQPQQQQQQQQVRLKTIRERQQEEEEEDDRDEDEADFSSENEFSIEGEDDEEEEEEEEEEESSVEQHTSKHKSKESSHHKAAHKIQNQWKKKNKKGKHSTTSTALATASTSVDDNSSSKKSHARQGSSGSTSHQSYNKEALVERHDDNNDDERYQQNSAADSKNIAAELSQARKGSSNKNDHAATASSSAATTVVDKNKPSRGSKTKKRSKQLKTVPPPSSELLAWQTWQLPVKRARRAVTIGLRVKVRFATQSAKQQQPHSQLVKKKKKKWFGGRVSAVSKEGSKIRIKYDDGTTEVTKFPDNDIVVDDEHNGQHAAPAHKFMPRPLPQDSEDDAVAKKQPGNKSGPSGEAGSENKKGPPEEPAEGVVEPSSLARGEQTMPEEQQQGEESEKRSVAENSTALSIQSTATTQPSDEVSGPRAAEQPPTSLAMTNSEQAPAAAVVVEPVKIKRKRGRPPKHRPPVDGAAATASGKGTKPATSETTAETPAPSRPSLTIRIPVLKKDDDKASPNQEQQPRLSPKNSKSPPEEGEIEESSPVKTKKRTAEELESSSSSPPQGPASKRIHIHVPAVAMESSNSGNNQRSTTPESMADGTTHSQLNHPDSTDSTGQRKKRPPSPPKRSPAHPKKKKRKFLESSDLKEQSSLKVPNLDHDASVDGGTAVADGDGVVNNDSLQQVSVTAGNNDPGSDNNNKPTTPRPRGNKVQQELEQQSSSLLIGDDNNALVVRSGRRAAQQANERISSRQENVIPDPTVKVKKKRRNKEGEGAAADSHENHPEDDSQWVQCDACSKWRIIPSSAVASLPKQWFCKDNVWDSKRASCDEPEQTAKQFAKERKRLKKKRKQRLMEAAAAAALAQTKEAAAEKFERSRSPKPKELVDDAALPPERTEVSSVNESQSKAEKKGSASVGKKARSSADDKDVAATEPTPDAPPRRGRGRPRRNANKEATSAPPSTQAQSDEADNVEWVQCEKCEKWRKLPPYISAGDLPDTWYCSMNTWNPGADCEDPEDKAEGLQDVGGFGASATSGLSYRNLIFGSTGRKANRPISERTRAAESLFGVITEDDDAQPTVMYANSSAFVSRSRSTVPDETPSLSVFELMNYSNLWSELRASQSFVGGDSGSGGLMFYGRPSSMSAYTFDTLPADIKQPVKDLVLRVLADKTLTGDEVVVEAQHGNLENLSEACVKARPYCTINVVVTLLCFLVREGTLECVKGKGISWTATDWNPRYRVARVAAAPVAEPLRTPAQERRESRCMKISKPWKRTRIQ